MRLHDVAMRYGEGREVLRGLDLELHDGDFYFLLGPSGSGKSSLLRVLSLSHAPSRGVVRAFGMDTRHASREDVARVRRRIGVVYQDHRLIDHLSAFDNVALPLRIHGAEDEQIGSFVSEVLGWLGLSDLIEAKPPELSMGQRQLIAIGRAVVTRPRILLADEPTSSVDSRRAGQIMTLFERLNQLGTALIFATHNMDLVQRYEHPLLHIINGRVISYPAAQPAAAD